MDRMVVYGHEVVDQCMTSTADGPNFLGRVDACNLTSLGSAWRLTLSAGMYRFVL